MFDATLGHIYLPVRKEPPWRRLGSPGYRWISKTKHRSASAPKRSYTPALAGVYGLQADVVTRLQRPEFSSLLLMDLIYAQASPTILHVDLQSIISGTSKKPIFAAHNSSLE